MPKKYQPTYWSGKGKHQRLYNYLYDHYVPIVGKASTLWGELIRCVSRIYYDIYNNGACNFDVLKAEREWLVRHMPPAFKKASRQFVHKPTDAEQRNENYQKFLDAYVDVVILQANVLLQASKMEE